MEALTVDAGCAHWYGNGRSLNAAESQAAYDRCYERGEAIPEKQESSQ
jgi:hypothetical protein